MEYTSKYKRTNSTTLLKIPNKKSSDYKSFDIPKDKYLDTRRIVKRRYE